MFSTKHKPIKYGFDLSKPPSHESVVAEIPSGQNIKFLPSSDNALWLFSRSWELCPHQINNTKATLIICHGTVDHSGVYHELAEELVKVMLLLPHVIHNFQQIVSWAPLVSPYICPSHQIARDTTWVPRARFFLLLHTLEKVFLQ
jgi:hypothetical protein